MSVPLREVAYTRFRESLFDRTLRAGQFVSQRELCGILDVPMGAVREALKRLEADGLINLIAQRGVQIADVNVVFINEAFEFRILIETEAARRMARDPDTKALGTLRERTVAIIDAAQKETDGDLLALGMEVDLDLHKLLITVFSNALIRQSYQVLDDKIRLIRLNADYSPNRLGAAMSEHLGIIDALVEGDQAAAVSRLSAHLTTSWRRSLGQPEDLF